MGLSHPRAFSPGTRIGTSSACLTWLLEGQRSDALKVRRENTKLSTVYSLKTVRALNQGGVKDPLGLSTDEFQGCHPPKASARFPEVARARRSQPRARVWLTCEHAWGCSSFSPTVYSGIPGSRPHREPRGAEGGRKRVLPALGAGAAVPGPRVGSCPAAGAGGPGRAGAPREAARPCRASRRARGLRRPAKHYSAPRVSLGSGRWREPAAFWLPWPRLNPAGGGPGPSPVASRPPRAVFAWPPRAAPGPSRPALAPIGHACRARALLKGWQMCVRPGCLRSRFLLAAPGRPGSKRPHPQRRCAGRVPS